MICIVVGGAASLIIGGALEGLGLGLLTSAAGTLFNQGPPARELTAREIGQIKKEDDRLRLLGETAALTEDPITGGTLLFRSSQADIPGLINQLALEAAVRKAEQAEFGTVPGERQLSGGEFPVTAQQIAAARAISGSPRVVIDPLPTMPLPPPPQMEPDPPLDDVGRIPPLPGPILRDFAAGRVLPPGCFPGTIAGRRACQPLRSAFV